MRDHLFAAPESVVRGWLRDGIDGWRLDVAFDIGFNVLQALTEAAHAEKPGSLVVGEIPNYPKEWFPSVDGVMHFAIRRLLLRMAPDVSRAVSRPKQTWERPRPYLVDPGPICTDRTVEPIGPNGIGQPRMGGSVIRIER